MVGELPMPNSQYGLEGVETLADPFDPRIAELFTELLTKDEPVFIARLGGSDFETVARYFDNRSMFDNEYVYAENLALVQNLNGYFDFEGKHENFFNYLEDLKSFYEAAHYLLYCNANMIEGFEHNAFPPQYVRLLRRICAGKTLINYTFVEAVMPFLNSFKTWGQGKKILVMSPFSASLQYQNERRNDLIVDYEFPDFELLTYDTPITYSTAGDSQETLKVSTKNWHEECRRMAGEIADVEFDIAFLSCASYSMYLGDTISRTMGRKAVYLGGILNVFFNIYGERYDMPFFNALMRPDTQIDAFENDEVELRQAGRSREREALRAYFGRKAR